MRRLTAAIARQREIGLRIPAVVLPVGLFRYACEAAHMETVRQGLRKGDIDKDTYERLVCGFCEEALKTRNPPDEVYKVRFCEECGREYRQIG